MVSHEELQTIASQPDEFTLSYVFSVQNFDSLHTLINRLIDATCGKCSKSSRTDIIALIDDLSSSAMTSTEFSSALNGIAYMLQHLASYGKVNGQRVGVLHVDGIDNKSLPLSHSLNMDQLLSYVQGIRKYSHTCSLTFCAASRSRNISTAINEAILTNFVNTDSKARKVLLVLTSGRFDNVDAVWKEVGAITLETGVYVFVIGAGYESNINGLQAIAQEPSNVFMVSDDNLETLDVIQSQLSYISCS
ncbi:hypothetical protein DPMN_099641 [Dreissena polymorpha]|uniref:VWFA domain-containing protein n=1 Tax=Dreissena polymorpha TaxID=45954 RepID=A0A9D4LFU5_DREPO|nr:hypothetical protein DPMN_099641 [Dreissena polymorpha]